MQIDRRKRCWKPQTEDKKRAGAAPEGQHVRRPRAQPEEVDELEELAARPAKVLNAAPARLLNIDNS